MRVIAGQFRGHPLRAPKGRLVRPTLDRARECLFAILSDRVVDSRFLDLFAGTGSVGIEAVSRGARHACLVEMRRSVVEYLEQNVQSVGAAERCEIMVGKLPQAVYRLRTHEPYDIIFIDPPYDTPEFLPTLEAVADSPWLLTAEGVVVVQHDGHRELSLKVGSLECFRDRSAGTTRFAFLRRRTASGPTAL